MKGERLDKQKNWLGGLLSLVLFAGGAQAWGSGLSLAARLAARQIEQVANQIAGSAKHGNLASNTRTLRVSMENALEAGDDTPEEVIARIKNILGKDDPLFAQVERLLGIKQVTKMSDQDRLALNGMLNSLTVYASAFKHVPICAGSCAETRMVDEGIEHAVVDVAPAILKSVQEKYAGTTDTRVALERELTDLRRSFFMRRLVTEKKVKNSTLEKLKQDLANMSGMDRSEMLSVLHAMNRSFTAQGVTAEDAARKKFFTTLLEFNSDDILANRLWRVAIADSGQIDHEIWNSMLRNIVKDTPNLSSAQRTELWISQMDRVVAASGKESHAKEWKEIKGNGLCGLLGKPRAAI